MDSNDESFSAQLTDEERKYLYLFFSSRTKLDDNNPKKITNLLNLIRKQIYPKSGS